MQIVDADTHVDENADTWSYLRPEEKHLEPTIGQPSNPDPKRPRYYWMIDGQRQPFFVRSDAKTRTTADTREIRDVKARLRDMDEMGVEYQVIYPTLFLIQIAERPETDLALKRAYNHWLGERCDESGGRLRWVCQPPLMTMDETLAEVRWAKDHGAVGIMKKGDKEAGRWLTDPYFFPLYKLAEELDMAICFHTGTGVYDRVPTKEATASSFMRIQTPVVNAFHSLISHRIPRQYPKLRFAFVEAGSAWVPYVLSSLSRWLNHPGEIVETNARFDLPGNVLAELNLFVTCLVDEDLKYIVQFSGEDNLIAGSDYTHADRSQQHNFIEQIGYRAQLGDISQAAVQKILSDNPRRLYGL